eukprot:TRINITY_DN1948_c0_g1_i1.p1 TRINITY_DN1948_c0_g1~~TRINITY_DN1948_c0_g1_i1.p1  ORF type:complete len:756 (+),score=151.61 TRINITY_DN1948_c0_g1_i1:57-2324(+)
MGLRLTAVGSGGLVAALFVVGLTCQLGGVHTAQKQYHAVSLINAARRPLWSTPKSNDGTEAAAVTAELEVVLKEIAWAEQAPHVREDVMDDWMMRRADRVPVLGVEFPEDRTVQDPWVGGTLSITAAVIYCDRPELVNGGNASRVLRALRSGALTPTRTVLPMDSVGAYDLTDSVRTACDGKKACDYAFLNPPPVLGCPGKLVVDHICDGTLRRYEGSGADGGVPPRTSPPRSAFTHTPREGVSMRCDAPSKVLSGPRVGRVVPVRYDTDRQGPFMLWPIQFAIPSAKFRTSVPWKSRDFAQLIPGNKDTYGFEAYESKEAGMAPDVQYWDAYARSYYCITRKKYGWDTLRHYEILAAGCVPYFVDLHRMPSATMVMYPKELVLEAMYLDGVHFDDSRPGAFHDPKAFWIDHKVFDKKRYFELAAQILTYARTRLSSERMSQYVLRALAAEGGPKAPRRVLFISQCFRDYLADSFWLGFNALHESGVLEEFTHVVSTAQNTHFHKDDQYNKGCQSGVKPHLVGSASRLDKQGFYASSTGWGHNAAANRMSAGVLFNESMPGTAAIKAKIASKYYDAVVYSSTSRTLAFIDEVTAVYPRGSVALLMGEDKPDTLFSLEPDVLTKKGVLFTREIYDDADGETWLTYQNYNANGAWNVDGYHCCDGSHDTDAHLYRPRPSHPTDSYWKHIGGEGDTVKCHGYARFGYAKDGAWARLRMDTPTEFLCKVRQFGGVFVDAAPGLPKTCECISFEDAKRTG